MAATTTRRSAVRQPRADVPPSDPPMEALSPAVLVAADLASEPAFLTPVVAALIRTVQAALASAAADLGRGDMGANAALVRLGAHRDDVEILRAFLAAQPRPAHIPEEY